MRQGLKTRDDRLTEAIGRTSSRLSRRSALAKGGGFMASAFAMAVLGPLNGKDKAFASSYECHPPCGQTCSGCTPAGGCPSSMVVCTSSDPYGGADGDDCCIYGSGWWYTAGSAGKRHLCRDCRAKFCPCCCNEDCCSGFCACRSTILY